MSNQTMNLLLVYPQQADGTKQRVSRASAQLNGIAKTTLDLLKRSTQTTTHVQSITYETGLNDQVIQSPAMQQDLIAALKDTDLVIDVSPTPTSNIQPHQFAGPVIHLTPTFQGSFACNEVSVTGCGRLMQSDVVQYVDHIRKPYLGMLPSTQELNANMHYSAFSPLPTRVGDSFYRTPKDHAVVFLSYPEHLRNEATIDADKQTLNDILHTVENLKSLTFICESLEDVPMIRQLADSLQQALALKATIWGLRKGDYHDLFSIMAKSSVAMFGGNALFTDAILRGIPVYPWRSNLPGTDIIAQAYRQYSSDRLTDRSALMSTQRKHLNRLIDAQYLDATLPNLRQCLDNALCELINQSLNSDISNIAPFTVHPADVSAPKWIIEPAKEPEKHSLPDVLTRSIWRDRQNVLQFKQSANRDIVSGTDRQDRQVFTKIK